MNLRAIHDQVIILSDPPVTTYKGIIALPEAVIAENPNYYTVTGRVVAVGSHSFERAKKGQYDFGDAVEARAFDVVVGDRVLYNRYAGKQITCDDDHTLYLVLRECEIMGVVTDDVEVQPGYQDATDRGVTEGVAGGM